MKAVVVLCLGVWLRVVGGFIVPSAIISSSHRNNLKPCALFPPGDFLVVDPPTIIVADAVDIAKNALIGVGTIVALLFGVALLFSTFVIPKAAEQLEIQARELDPALWAEYEEKLEPGEVLAVRPDLLQELGEKVRARMIEKFEEAEKRQASRSKENSDGSSSAVLEAEIISKESSKQE